MQFLSSESAFFLYKSMYNLCLKGILLSCMNSDPDYYMEMVKGLLFLHLLLLLAQSWNVSSLSLFCITAIAIHLNKLKWFQALSLEGIHSLLKVAQFLSNIITYVNRFFPHTVNLWNYLPAECFLLTYDWNGFFWV